VYTLQIKSGRQLALIVGAVVLVLTMMFAWVIHQTSVSNPSSELSAHSYAVEGVAAFKAGNLTLAATLFQQEIDAAQTDNEKAVAYYNLGTVVVRQQHIDEARAAFAQSVHFAPSYSNAWLNLGMVQQSLKQWSESVTSFNRVLALNSTNAPALFGRGVAQYHLGKLSAATADMANAVREDPALRSRVPAGITLP
jgi:tetratricopeptide (TPR) repeat protein